MENVIPISIRNTLISGAVFASVVSVTLAVNGVPAAVQSVGRTVITLASFVAKRPPLTKHYGANVVFGSNGKIIGAASDPTIRSLWLRQGLPE